MFDEDDARRDGEARQQGPARITTAQRTAEGDHRSRGAHDEHDRRRQGDLPASKLGQELHGARGVPIRRAAALSSEADPVIGRVPREHRHKGGNSRSRAGPEPRRTQHPPQAGNREQPERETQRKKNRRVFARERRAAGEADGEPPAVVARHQPASRRRQAGGPEQQQWNVWRHDHGTGAEHERRVQQQRRGQPGTPVRKQIVGGAGEQQGARGRRERRQQPDTERRRIGERGTEADHQGDHRRMIGISGRQRARPHPVVRLIRRQRHQCRNEQAQRGQRGYCRERHVHGVGLTEAARPASSRRRSSTRRRSPPRRGRRRSR